MKHIKRNLSNANYLNATLYIPMGSLVSYQSADNWKYFLMEEIDVTGLKNAKADKDVVEMVRYSLDGQKFFSPTKGINIIKMSDGTSKKVFVK